MLLKPLVFAYSCWSGGQEPHAAADARVLTAGVGQERQEPGAALPLPCVSAGFAAKALPLRAVFSRRLISAGEFWPAARCG